MRIVQINTYNYGSTGRIMLGINDVAQEKGIESTMYCCDMRGNRRNRRENNYLFSSIWEHNIHIKLNELTGYNGMYSKRGTKKLIEEIKKINPDIVQLHNLHNCYVNLPMLFQYFKDSNMRVVWTFHDCWPFTGQCAYFTMVGCEKWRTQCHHCEQHLIYPKSYVDRTFVMYNKKKEWFNGLNHLTIVTPSMWLSRLVRESYLKNYDVRVINNGIDLDVFKPVDKNYLREKYEIGEDVKIILGVAFGWSPRKGLDFFVELSKKLNRDKYRIVLVGTDDKVDRNLPRDIISIHRTLDQHELAKIYSSADVFMNPTLEEVLGMVNAEALACGTPVVTFNTGGCPEIVDTSCGIVIDEFTTDALLKAIESVFESKQFTQINCLARAKEFEQNKCFEEYIALYNS